MKRIIYVTSIVSALFLIACPTVDDEDMISVNNNSTYDISCYFSSYFSSKYGDSIYPDTVLSPYMKERRPYDVPKSKSVMFEDPLVEIYKMAQTDTLSFFIFATDTLKKYSWDVIRQDYKILQRYDLNLQDFKHLGYTIIYPPTEKMKDIKMYPPYGQ